MQNQLDFQKKIIEYWDKAGICSFDSSTCAGDKYLASCTNFVESRLLEGLLARHGYNGGKGMGVDIGAGLGRFTVIMSRHLGSVHALEPAKSLYPELVSNCSGLDNVRVFNEDFEAFNIQEDYDAAVMSGVLYLYSDNMVTDSLKKLAEHFRPGSIIVIRDFIAKDQTRQVPSSYIDGGFCYYRDISYWTGLAKEHGFELVEVFQAKPTYPVPKLMRLLGITGLRRLFNVPLVKRIMYQNTETKRRKGVLDYSSSPILTVFLVMRKQ